MDVHSFAAAAGEPMLKAVTSEEYVVSNSLTIPVDAAPAAVRAAHARLDPAGALRRALDLDLEVDVSVERAGRRRSALTIRVRFYAADEAARIELLEHWALIEPLAASATRRAACTIAWSAERDEFSELRRAA